jgi:hypothetical protein
MSFLFGSSKHIKKNMNPSSLLLIQQSCTLIASSILTTASSFQLLQAVTARSNEPISSYDSETKKDQGMYNFVF